uniref:Spastin/Vps4 C-terminal domain-containing protein n=1 Tax=Quercus lobata TaxID=97700 RepID=A0A7N2MQH4_QUELO
MSPLSLGNGSKENEGCLQFHSNSYNVQNGRGSSSNSPFKGLVMTLYPTMQKNVLVLAATNTPFAADMVHIGNTPHNPSTSDFKELARDTSGFSGSDIVFALVIQLPSNTKADFDNVLATQKPTVSEADLKVCEKFTREYGLYG